MEDERGLTEARAELSCLEPTSRPVLPQASNPGRGDTPAEHPAEGTDLLSTLTSQTINLALFKGPMGGD